MAAKRYTVDVNGTKETIQTYTVLGGGGAKGEGLRFRLTKGAKVELTDDAARNGPQGIKVRRIGDDLHIALPGSDVAKPDVVIQDFYKANEGNQLIGRGADGQYHSYAVDKISTNLPATPEMTSAVTSPWGKVTEAVAPVIATETVPTAPPSTAPAATEGAKMGALGWVLGGVGVLGIAAAAGGGGGGSSTNPDAPIKSVEPTVAPGNANEGDPASFTVTLRNPGNTATTWTFSVGGDTASAADIDVTKLVFSNNVTYNSVDGTITVPANVGSFTVSVPTVNDTLIEANEAIKLDVGGTSGSLTIVDNDVQKVATVVATNGAAIVEGGTLAYTITLNAPSARTETYTLTLAGGTTGSPIAPGSDVSGFTFSNGVTYDAATGQVTVPAGVETFSLNIVTADDVNKEGAETLQLSVGGVTASGTITDNDSQTVSTVALTSAATVNEGAPITYQVTLSGSSNIVEVHAFSFAGTTVAADHGTPTFTNGVTYNATAGTISVPVGVTNFQVTVPTVNDAIFEAAETLNVSVGGKVGGTVTLNSQDAAPTITLTGAATHDEGSATTAVTYTATLSAASGLPATVNYATTAGTATAGSDFTATTGTLTFAAGTTTQTFTVNVANDQLIEGSETFNVALSAPTNAALGATSSVTTTIVDDDVQKVSGLTVAPASVAEGGDLVYTVTLSAPSPTPTSYALALTGTATAGADYPAAAGFTFSDGVTLTGSTLNIPANTSGFTIKVPTTTDTVAGEGDQTVILGVGGAAGLTATGTISDATPALAASAIAGPAAAVAEGANMVYTVTLNGSSATAQNLPFSFTGVAATATDHGTPSADAGVTISGNDFVVPANVSTFKVTVPITGDNDAEPVEDLVLHIGTVSGSGSIAASTAPSATAASLTVAPAAIDEGGAAATASYTLVLSGPANGTESFTLTAGAAAPGVADLATDFGGIAAVSGGTVTGLTITPTAGASSVVFSLTAVADATTEGTETLSLSVPGAAAAALTVNDTSLTVVPPPITASRSVTAASLSGAATHIDILDPNTDGTSATLAFHAGANGDLLDVTSLLTKAQILDGQPVSGDSFDAMSGATHLTGSNVFAVQADLQGTAPSTDAVATLLSQLTLDDGSRQVLVLGDSTLPGTAIVYTLQDSASDGNTTLQASELAVAATLNFGAGTSFDDLLAENFQVARTTP